MKKLSIFIAALFLISCTSKQKEEPQDEPQKASAPTVSMESKQLAAEQQAAHSAEITFDKGSSQLSSRAKDQLKELIEDAQQSGPVESIRVISWADSEYPSVNTKELSPKEQKLAEERGKNIEKFVSLQSRRAKVETYNMAERPGAWDNMINSPESRIKKSLEVSGVPTTDTSVKNPSKASKAIVLVVNE